MRFSDLVAAPKHKAAIVAQAPVAAPVAAPVPTAGVTVADLRQAARRFHERSLAAGRAGRSDDFAARNANVADDLAAKLQRFGSFVSAKQAEYAAKIVSWSLPREGAVKPSLPAAKPLPAIFEVVRAFAKVRVGEISFSKKNGEPLWWVKSGDVLVGKLDAEGAVLFGRRIADAGLDRAAIDAALDRIEADPEAAIKAHGLVTGSCGCCGRELTDPESIAAGIGPICAGRAGF